MVALSVFSLCVHQKYSDCFTVKRKMSTRWYPIYQKGNPQLRVFLPNFWMKLIQSKYKQQSNVVVFHCSMEMTTKDIKNYLEKIYAIDVVQVRMYITMGRFKKDRLQGAVIKEEDRKIAYVTLPKDKKFEFPTLFKDSTYILDEENISQTKKNLQDFINESKAPGLPGWFRV
ncbi:39S ribosomal protein L23, mitochondrial [Pseudomyrmex gracilis]|uniref:39S ribosomal protein L23, mitochondrial n=1 Tax=Pseudomyrmex gracilis TaxID=219809 RepID=UPI000995A906|nr:39S ribosomal protein L23, mitochondrial [Pseudomyrmex gracilis]